MSLIEFLYVLDFLSDKILFGLILSVGKYLIIYRIIERGENFLPSQHVMSSFFPHSLS